MNTGIKSKWTYQLVKLPKLDFEIFTVEPCN